MKDFWQSAVLMSANFSKLWCLDANLQKKVWWIPKLERCPWLRSMILTSCKPAMMDGLGQSSHSMLRNLVLIYRLQKQGFHRTCTFFFANHLFGVNFLSHRGPACFAFWLVDFQGKLSYLAHYGPVSIKCHQYLLWGCWRSWTSQHSCCQSPAYDGCWEAAWFCKLGCPVSCWICFSICACAWKVCPVLWGWPPMGSNQVPEYFFHGGQICQLGKGILSSCGRSRVFQHKHVPTAETWITLLQFDSTQGKDSRWFCQAAEQIWCHHM